MRRGTILPEARLRALPLRSHAELWGEQVYFVTPVEAPDENPRGDVPFGAVAYWSDSRAVCRFFGEKPYSPVTVLGTIEGNAAVLARVNEDDPVRVELEDGRS